jgi:hypothetical protein
LAAKNDFFPIQEAYNGWKENFRRFDDRERCDVVGWLGGWMVGQFDSPIMPYRSSASFGKRQEYIAVAELLRRGHDVYMTLVDDQLSQSFGEKNAWYA